MTKNDFDENLTKEYEIFDKIAPHSNKLQQKIGSLLHNHIKDKYKNPTLLDIGGGYGLPSIYVLSKFQECKLFFNEFDSGLIKKARKNLNSKRVTFLEGDISTEILKIPNQSLDAIYTSYTIHNFKIAKRKKLFNLISKKLVPGGVFI